VTRYPNWFACYADRFFAHHLTPLAGRSGLRFLQIGAFTGDASLWLFDYILTGAGSTLTDVDTWEGSDEPDHEAFDFADVERVYDRRTTGFFAQSRLTKFKGTSAAFFRSCSPDDLFDFIYVDGDHTWRGVETDGYNAYQRLKVGGLIAFDDYLWRSGKGVMYDPGRAIDAVARFYSNGRLERLENPAFPGASPLQVWFRKTR
jgi:hypothetical protein